MAKDLTEKQEKVLSWIKESIKTRGEAPTVRELQEKMGCSSPMGVVSHLRALETKGQIRRLGNQTRGILVLDGLAKDDSRFGNDDDVVRVPLVGNVACGMPIWAEEMIEEWIPLSTKLVRSAQDVFMLRAKGDSMNLAGIDEGDYIVFKKQNYADNGEKVVVLIGTEATVKRIRTDKQRVVFEPMSTNPNNKPIIPEAGTFMVQGRVIGVIKNFKGE
jgi:repressor LexA